MVWQYLISFKCFLALSLKEVEARCEKETVHRIWLHCSVGVNLFLWPMGSTWRGYFVEKKRRKTWNSIPLCIIWLVWRNGSLWWWDFKCTEWKHSFVYNLWSWNRVFLGRKDHSLIDFLEWMTSYWGVVRFFSPLFFFWLLVYNPYYLVAVFLLLIY